MKKKVKDLKYGEMFDYEGNSYSASTRLKTGELLFYPKIYKPLELTDEDEVEVWDNTEEYLIREGSKIRIVSPNGASCETKIMIGEKMVENVTKADIRIRPNENIEATLEISSLPCDIKATVTDVKYIDQRIGSIKKILGDYDAIDDNVIKDYSLRCVSAVERIKKVLQGDDTNGI